MKIQLDEVFDKISVSLQEHSERVGHLLCLMVNGDKVFMEKLGFETVEELNTALSDAGLYHDVGKILYSPVLAGRKKTLEMLNNVSDSLHPMCSHMIIERFGGTIWLSEGHKKLVMDSALYHHERYNGFGYPNGIQGDEIPLSASLCSIANYVDNTIVCRNSLNANNLEVRMNRITSLVDLWHCPVAVEYFERAKQDIMDYYINEVLKEEVVNLNR